MKRLLGLLLLASSAFAQLPLAITTSDNLLVAMKGKVYLQALVATGGQAPYTWSISGNLPAGLSLEGAFIQGTPTKAAVVALDLVVTDSAKPRATAAKTVNLAVQHEYGPYATPEEVTICQMAMSYNPPIPAIDEVTQQPRCFVVPAVVSDSMTRHLVTETEGLDMSGNVKYKYASWWDYVIKFFVNKLVIPVIDEFPSPELVAAKAQADIAVKAVDAAKAAILSDSNKPRTPRP